MFHHNPKDENSLNFQPNDNQLPTADHNSAVGKNADIQSTATDPTGSYRQKQTLWDLDYLKNYNSWLSQKTPEELQALKVLGLHKPMVGYVAKGAAKQDLADSPAASYEPDFAAIIDGEITEEPEHAGTMDACEALRHFIAEILTHANVRLTIECFELIFNLSGYEGDSMSDIAERHGISPAAVSKRCLELCEEYNIKGSRAMYQTKNKAQTDAPDSP